MCLMSMTGFGRAMVSADDERSWLVEIKSVNYRFLEQRIILPKSYNTFEDRIRKLIASRFSRGRVETTIRLDRPGQTGSKLQLDMSLANQHYDCLQALQRQFALEPEIRLADMLIRDGIIREVEPELDLEEDWQLLSRVVTKALDDCERMRAYEGENLGRDLNTRLNEFARLIFTVEADIVEVLRFRQDELKVRIEKLLTGFDLDPARLAQECAFMADKADVTEELVRLRSHVDQFSHFLALDEPVGRRLDFLLQEFLREVNTLASKISNPKIAYLGVEMKNEVEKLREQIQNLE